MEKGGLLFTRAGNRIHLSDVPGKFMMEFNDEEARYDGESLAAVPGRAGLSMRIAAAAFRLLELNGHHSFFVKEAGETVFELDSVKMYPLRVTCRNAAAGGFAKRMKMPEGTVLPVPVAEFKLGGDMASLEATPLGKSHVILDISDGEVKMIQHRTFAVNRVLKTYLAARGLVLADFTIEFGTDDAGVMSVASAFHSDCATLWDRDAHEKIDRGQPLHALRGSEQDYRFVLKALVAQGSQ
jgi:phosphoribosylaminoimidazole-succinocarboxamide synthase